MIIPGTLQGFGIEGWHRLNRDYPFRVDQDYLVTGEMVHIRENGASSGVGVLATYAYDDLGRRTSLTRGDGSVLSYSYDSVSRPTRLADDLSGTSYDQTLGFSYNPASQIVSNTRSNDAYAWNVNRGYTANGLNQYTASGSVTPTYDSKGNLTSAGSTTYTYSSENLLTSASGGITLAYAPAMRLYQTAGGSAGTTRFQYDGTALIAEYNSSNTLQRRFVHGPGTDEPIAWYEGSGTTDPRFLHADERGSVVAVTSSSGTLLNVNTYDEYGILRSSNSGRFQYTGQTWLPDLGMYYYKARIYSPTLGRFLQADSTGYADGMNRYVYSGANPVGRIDPTGNESCPPIAAGHGHCDPVDELRQYLSKYGIDASDMSTADVLAASGDLIQQLEHIISDWSASVIKGMINGQITTADILTPDPMSPLPAQATYLDPLTGSEKAIVDLIMPTSNMKNKMADAWAQTLATGLEHGFFVQVSQIGTVYTFRFSAIFEGNAGDMGWKFSYVADHLSSFYLSYHAHPGDYYAATFASIADHLFDVHYHAIGVIQTRAGIIIGH